MCDGIGHLFAPQLPSATVGPAVEDTAPENVKNGKLKQENKQQHTINMALQPYIKTVMTIITLVDSI